MCMHVHLQYVCVFMFFKGISQRSGLCGDKRQLREDWLENPEICEWMVTVGMELGGTRHASEPFRRPHSCEAACPGGFPRVTGTLPTEMRRGSLSSMNVSCDSPVFTEGRRRGRDQVEELWVGRKRCLLMMP